MDLLEKKRKWQSPRWSSSKKKAKVAKKKDDEFSNFVLADDFIGYDTNPNNKQRENLRYLLSNSVFKVFKRKFHVIHISQVVERSILPFSFEPLFLYILSCLPLGV
jgi:hypothetical protein